MSIKKRVVVVQNSIKSTFLFRRNYLRKLVQIADVLVIAPNDSDFHKKKLEELGVSVYNVPCLDSLANKVLSFLIMNYYIFVERIKGSTFICHFLVTFLYCYPTLVLFNKRLVIYTEGLGSFFTKNLVALKVLRFFLVANYARRLFCNASERNELGLATDKVTGGIGINLVDFQQSFNSKRLSRDSFNLLYVGRLIADKGVNDAISVFTSLENKGHKVTLTLVGDIYPNNPSSLTEQDIAALKITYDQKVKFVGFCKDVNYWYERSDILLLPSIREGFPVVVMEASSKGLPTVGYRVPGVMDAVLDEVNGKLVPFRDLDALVLATEFFLCNEKLKQYKKSSHDYAIKNFCANAKSTELITTIISVSNN